MKWRRLIRDACCVVLLFDQVWLWLLVLDDAAEENLGFVVLLGPFALALVIPAILAGRIDASVTRRFVQGILTGVLGWTLVFLTSGISSLVGKYDQVLGLLTVAAGMLGVLMSPVMGFIAIRSGAHFDDSHALRA